MSYEIGCTVLAVRDGSASSMNVFGEGVYIGDRIMPGHGTEPSEIDREAILQVITEDDAVSPEESRLTAFSVDVAEAHGHDVEEARTASIATIKRERAKPLEVRIQELWESTVLNPCIYLDSGDIVYGFQCWWGPLARFKKQAPLAVHVIVPVPNGNGRWK